MSEMIERVARAIAESQRSKKLTDDEWAEAWKWHTSRHTVAMGGEWETLRAARAAIEAMREPTEAMSEDAREAWMKDTTDLDSIYQAMIDIASGKAA